MSYSTDSPIPPSTSAIPGHPLGSSTHIMAALDLRADRLPAVLADMAVTPIATRMEECNQAWAVADIELRRRMQSMSIISFQSNNEGCHQLTDYVRGQYSDAVLDSLESQNESEIEGISAKVKMLKDVCAHYPLIMRFLFSKLYPHADIDCRSPLQSAMRLGRVLL